MRTLLSMCSIARFWRQRALRAIATANCQATSCQPRLCSSPLNPCIFAGASEGSGKQRLLAYTHRASQHRFAGKARESLATRDAAASRPPPTPHGVTVPSRAIRFAARGSAPREARHPRAQVPVRRVARGHAHRPRVRHTRGDAARCAAAVTILYREVRVSSQAASKRATKETSSGARSAKERFGLRQSERRRQRGYPRLPLQ